MRHGGIQRGHSRRAPEVFVLPADAIARVPYSRTAPVTPSVRVTPLRVDEQACALGEELVVDLGVGGEDQREVGVLERVVEGDALQAKSRPAARPDSSRIRSRAVPG
jgi:hypothetical protein